MNLKHAQYVLAVLRKVRSLDNFMVEGCFTCFAGAGMSDLSYAEEQYVRFLNVLAMFEKEGINLRYRHCCDSPATLNFPEKHLDAVRTGSLLIGFYPSPYAKRPIDLTLAFEFKTSIALVKDVSKGEKIGLRMMYEAGRKMRIAVLPVGAVDGFPQAMFNKGAVLVKGHRCPVVGAVGPDYCTIDISAVSDCSVGDEVVLIGRQGKSEITLYEFAHMAGVDSFELIPSTISHRVARVYV